MPHKVHAARVPSSAKTVVREGAAAGTLYTVPAGKTLVILAVWSATTTASVTVVAEDDAGTHVICGGGPLSVSVETRCAAGSIVVQVGAGASGFSGYLENA
jgi:hypothetical protein